MQSITCTDVSRRSTNTPHYITLHHAKTLMQSLHIAMYCRTILHYIALHYATYITLHCTTLHYITLHYITLHYTTFQSHSLTSMFTII